MRSDAAGRRLGLPDEDLPSSIAPFRPHVHWTRGRARTRSWILPAAALVLAVALSKAAIGRQPAGSAHLPPNARLVALMRSMHKQKRGVLYVQHEQPNVLAGLLEAWGEGTNGGGVAGLATRPTLSLRDSGAAGSGHPAPSRAAVLGSTQLSLTQVLGTNADSRHRDVKDDIHMYRVGMGSDNSSAAKELAEADRIVTKPDTIQNAEDALKRRHHHHRDATINVTAYDLPAGERWNGVGAFRWVAAKTWFSKQDGKWEDVPERNSSEYGSWVWCHNRSKVDGIYFANATMVGARRLGENETIDEVGSGCIIVDAPGWQASDKVAEERTEGEREDEEQWASRDWDEPFMTYEPHPSSVGWIKRHWSSADWLTWLVLGPLLSVAFSAFILLTFGQTAAAFAIGLTVSVDLITFYWNF